MNIERLEYFSTLASYLNYSRAAEQLFISQPSLSKQITQLEKELGIQLLNRNKHIVSLTKEGEECLALIRPLLNDYRQLKEWAAEKNTAQPTPSICIGYYGMLLQDVVLSTVNGLMTRQPNMDISLKNYSPSAVITSLQNGIIDLAILRDSYCRSLKEIHAKRICTIRQYLLAAKTHPLAGRQAVRPADLKDENFIDLFQKDSPQGHDDMLLLCRKYGLEPRISHCCDEPNSYIMMIQSGRGIGISHACQNSSLSGISLIELDCLEEDLTSDIMAVWKKEKEKTNAKLFSKIIPEICEQLFDTYEYSAH